MKLFGRKVDLPITLLPLARFQRELLAGMSGVLIWLVATFWGLSLANPFNWWNGWEISPILQSVSFHFQQAFGTVSQKVFGSGVLSFATDIIFSALPTVLSFILFVSGVAMVLSAYKIIACPVWLRWVGPAVLGSTIVAVLFVVLVVPPFSAIVHFVFPYYPTLREFSLNVGQWFSFMIAALMQLAVPIAAVILSLVPIFAPAKK